MRPIDIYQKLKKNLNMVHWNKIGGRALDGCFSLNGCHGGQEFWIELMAMKSYPLLNNKKLNWAEKRWTNGGKVYILAYSQKVRNLYIYTPPFMTNENMYIMNEGTPLQDLVSATQWFYLLAFMKHG